MSDYIKIMYNRTIKVLNEDSTFSKRMTLTVSHCLISYRHLLFVYLRINLILTYCADLLFQEVVLGGISEIMFFKVGRFKNKRSHMIRYQEIEVDRGGYLHFSCRNEVVQFYEHFLTFYLLHESTKNHSQIHELSN